MTAAPIMLNDLLHLSDEELENTKIRLNRNSNGVDPLEEFKRDPEVINVGWLLYRTNKRYFQVGQHVICLVRMSGDRWLFTTMKTITKDLDIVNGVSYEGTEWSRFASLYGRVIVKYHSTFQQAAPYARTLMDQLEVLEVLPDQFDDDPFPGYDNVRLRYPRLKRILDRGLRDWTAALEHQKGVYLITDLATGKLYVGSATADNGMLLRRWSDYVATGHGGNKELVELVDERGFDYVRDNFQYSLLENYNARVDDRVILQREAWWKETLASRTFGYNAN